MMVTVVQVKLAAMIAVGAGSFIVGIAPACFVSRIRDLQQRLLLSCILCFGGGVLLATSVLHMLPETRENMPEYAELVFACGFLLLYLVDETVHYIWGSDAEHDHQTSRQNSRNWTTSAQMERGRSQSYQVSCSTGAPPVRSACISDVNPKQPYQPNSAGNENNNGWRSTYGAVQCTPSAPVFCYNEEATFLCHGNHTEPCSDSNASLVGLALALTVHSVLEGLAIGVQKAMSEVLLLVGAVASHKFVVGFCLGLELAGANSSFCRLLSAILVFSGGSVVGIGIGMLTLRMNDDWTNIVLPILQGLAGGTLLYVTVSEVFPRERARWHKSSRRAAGIFQFLSAIVGFVVIFLLNNYVNT